MNRLEAALRRIAADLDRTGRPWCLIGGLAVSARTEPRFTRDIDVALSVPDDAAAEQLVHALLRRGYRPFATLEQEPAGRLATVRLVPPDEEPSGIITDLLFSSSGIEPETAAAAQRLELFPGLAVPVAQLAHLIALKVLSLDDVRRPQDRVDIQKMLGAVDETDLDEVRRLLDLIRDRRCDRGKDLYATLEAVRRPG